MIEMSEDLVIRIMEFINTENGKGYTGLFFPVAFEDVEPSLVTYHLEIMSDDKMIVTAPNYETRRDFSHQSGLRVKRLTSFGHAWLAQMKQLKELDFIPHPLKGNIQ